MLTKTKNTMFKQNAQDWLTFQFDVLRSNCICKQIYSVAVKNVWNFGARQKLKVKHFMGGTSDNKKRSYLRERKRRKKRHGILKQWRNMLSDDEKRTHNDKK